MARSPSRRPSPRALALAALVALAVAACTRAAPEIVIREVPPAAEGGPTMVGRIAGRVRGAQPGDTIVLYARSGLWYVQPLRAEPFTAIAADGTWAASIHLGVEYAALLVRPGYHPPHTLSALPPVEGLVTAVTRVDGSGDDARPRPRTVRFGGHDWVVRQAPSERGGFNQYDPGNVRIADDGALHLALRSRDGEWTGAEVALERPLGYGTYTFSVRDTGPLDPAAHLTFYTYDEDGPAEHFREMAIALRRADARGRLAGQYILQPNHVAANVRRFVVPPGLVTHSLRWEPGRVVFATSRGRRPLPAGPDGLQQEFTVGVPSAGRARMRIALYYFRKALRPPEGDVEVVIDRFQHFP